MREENQNMILEKKVGISYERRETEFGKTGEIQNEILEKKFHII